MSYWRKIARPIIAEIIKEYKIIGDDATLRKALREAYPFGERKYFPYKVWCDEIKKQLGTKKYKVKPQIVNPLQTRMF